MQLNSLELLLLSQIKHSLYQQYPNINCHALISALHVTMNISAENPSIFLLALKLQLIKLNCVLDKGDNYLDELSDLPNYKSGAQDIKSKCPIHKYIFTWICEVRRQAHIP